MIYPQYTSNCVNFVVENYSFFTVKGIWINYFVCSLCPSVISPKSFSKTPMSVWYLLFAGVFQVAFVPWISRLGPPIVLLKIKIKCYINQASHFSKSCHTKWVSLSYKTLFKLCVCVWNLLLFKILFHTVLYLCQGISYH